MPKILNCNFCGKPIKPGEGLMYVRIDGTIERYCSSKCFKSSVKLHRNPRKVKWVRKKNT